MCFKSLLHSKKCTHIQKHCFSKKSSIFENCYKFQIFDKNQISSLACTNSLFISNNSWLTLTLRSSCSTPLNGHISPYWKNWPFLHSFHYVLQDTITPSFQARGLSINALLLLLLLLLLVRLLLLPPPPPPLLTTTTTAMSCDCEKKLDLLTGGLSRLQNDVKKSIREDSSSAKACVTPMRKSSGQSPDWTVKLAILPIYTIGSPIEIPSSRKGLPRSSSNSN